MLEEMLTLMRRLATVADYVDELRAAKVSPAEFRTQLSRFQQGVRILGEGRATDAENVFQELTEERPGSPTATVALATVQAVNQDPTAEQRTLAMAVQLLPRDKELKYLHRRLTAVDHASLRSAQQIDVAFPGTWSVYLKSGTSGKWDEVSKTPARLWLKSGELYQLEAKTSFNDDHLQGLHLLSGTELQKLNLRGTSITDAAIVHLKTLTKLQWLDLSETRVTDAGFKSFPDLKRLAAMNLWRCALTDAGLASISSFTALRWLDLGYTMVTDAGIHFLRSLPFLQSLSLWGCSQITDDGLRHLQGFLGLQALNLGYTSLTDIALTYLLTLPDLQWLHLGGTNVTDAGLVRLGNLSKLRVLDVRECHKVSDTQLSELSAALPRCAITH